MDPQIAAFVSARVRGNDPATWANMKKNTLKNQHLQTWEIECQPILGESNNTKYIQIYGSFNSTSFFNSWPFDSPNGTTPTAAPRRVPILLKHQRSCTASRTGNSCQGLALVAPVSLRRLWQGFNARGHWPVGRCLVPSLFLHFVPESDEENLDRSQCLTQMAEAAAAWSCMVTKAQTRGWNHRGAGRITDFNGVHGRILKVESPFSGSYRIPWNFPFFTLRIPHFGSGTCWSWIPNWICTMILIVLVEMSADTNDPSTG